MTTETEQAAFVPPTWITATVLGAGGIRYEMPAIATDNPHLVITPRVDRHGRPTDSWSLTHVPTGYRLPTPMFGDSPADLLDLARRVAHLDWSSPDPAVLATENRDAYLKATRSSEEWDPSPFEKPRQDSYGEGEGMARRCLPLMAEVLDWYQHAIDRQRDTPLYLEDGKTPNPEWTHQTVKMVDRYGMAFLLGALHQLAPEHADQVAASLSDAWEAGDCMGEWAWSWRRALKDGEPLHLPGVPTPVPAGLFEVDGETARSAL